MIINLVFLCVIAWCVQCRGAFTLDINCTRENLKGTACINHIRSYLYDYTSNQSYNRLSLPVEYPYWDYDPPPAGVNTDHVSVDCLVTFKDLISVDTVSGTMTASVFVDFFWVDKLISWDPQWTDNYGYLDIPPDLLWVPDIQVYNVVGTYERQMATPAVFLWSNGSMWWSNKGMIIFSCDYDTTDFPFDTQSCAVNFASWIYATYQLDITHVDVVVDKGFHHLAWKTKQVTAQREVTLQWEVFEFTFATYTIDVERYYDHYVTTAIVPSLIITYITLVALFISEINSRLALAVTGLLTVVAVQWTVSADLPVSEGQTWMGRFANCCLAFVACVCGECYLAGYMASKKQRSAPKWVVYLIKISLLHQALYALWNPKASFKEDDSRIELSIMNATCDSSNPINCANALQRDKESGPAAKQDDYTWLRGARALDRISRVIFPVLYTILVIVLFADILS